MKNLFQISNHYELLAGAEYDINKRWTVSAGWQNTHYGLGDNSEFISDMSFVTSSNSVGLGARFQMFKKVALNVSYFHTFYKHYEREQNDYNHLAKNFAGQLSALGGKLGATYKQNVEHIARIDALLGANKISPAQIELAKAHREVLVNQNTIYQAELGALGAIQQGAGKLSTAGVDNFHRTNFVFGLGLEIDF